MKKASLKRAIYYFFSSTSNAMQIKHLNFEDVKAAGIRFEVLNSFS